MAADTKENLFSSLGLSVEDFFKAAPCFLTVQDRDYKVIDANQSATDAVVRQGLQAFRADREDSERNADRINQESTP